MTFWELIWALVKLGVIVYIGVPLAGLLILLLILIFL